MQRRAFLAALAALALPSQAQTPSRKRLTLMTYPGTGRADIPTGEFMEGITPLRRELEQVTRRSVAVTLVRTLRDMNAAAGSRQRAPDLAYGPATSAAIYMDAGYLPLVRVARMASGVIASKMPLDAIRSVAFPDPESWLAQVGEYTVEALTGRRFEFHFAKTQDAAVEAMRYGLADAVAIRPGTLKKLQEADPAYRVIAQLPKTPDFTFLAHPRLDDFAREAVKDALLQLPNNVTAALDRVYHVKVEQFAWTNEDEYDALRRIVAAAKRLGA